MPTGNFRRELGEGTTTISPFLATGKAWGEFVSQGSLKFEYPFVARRAPKGILYNLALSYPIFDLGQGNRDSGAFGIQRQERMGHSNAKAFSVLSDAGGSQRTHSRRELGDCAWSTSAGNPAARS